MGQQQSSSPQSSPTARTEYSSDSLTTPRRDYSAASSGIPTPEDEIPQPLADYGEDDEVEQSPANFELLPAWATTPVLPKPRTGARFGGFFRSPLKDLQATR